MEKKVPEGWTAEKVSLFDEEGVEGWMWKDGNGNEMGWVIGSWDEPPPPPEDTF